MKLTNKQKAHLREIAPQCADRLADKMWNILDLDEIADNLLSDNQKVPSTAEMYNFCDQVGLYLTTQIGKML